jgi:hypothetical protein
MRVETSSAPGPQDFVTVKVISALSQKMKIEAAKRKIYMYELNAEAWEAYETIGRIGLTKEQKRNVSAYARQLVKSSLVAA